MKPNKTIVNRRNFISKATIATTGLFGLSCTNGLMATEAPIQDDSIYMIGPLKGYSPQIGTLVSMLNYNRQTIINAVKSLSMEELDYLHDAKANTIGALVMHLGATERYYQVNSFDGKQEFGAEDEKFWGSAMNLGDQGRKNIKGKEVKYYLDLLAEVRQKTLNEFKKKDDKWLMAIDPEWSKQNSLNTYWKWFHVCEHESNHRGQITWLKSRLPGAKASND